MNALANINLKPVNAAEALVALENVSKQLWQARDWRAIFPDVYAIVTGFAKYHTQNPTGFFQEPAFISRLAGVFAERYLDTLGWSLEKQTQDCAAWAIAYDYSQKTNTVPFLHAALGISAHINYDLALGISQTIRELGTANDQEKMRRYKHDHDKVNILLEATVAQTIERLTRIYGCDYADTFEGGKLQAFATRLVMARLSDWREQVWENVILLLDAQTSAEQQQILKQMNRTAGQRCKQLQRLARIRPFLPLLNFSKRLRRVALSV